MIAICTPTRDVIQAGTVFDLVQLVKHSPDTFFAISQGTFLISQRTTLVKQVIASHASHLLFIDSDMRFPKDTLERLLKHEVDIVGINAKHRQANKWSSGISSKGKTGLKEVKVVGFGVTLIRTAVFFKILEPWFATPYNGEELISDDVFFCHKAREAGIK